jgi:nicotinamide-nucleotide adenylyltransferase
MTATVRGSMRGFYIGRYQPFHDGHQHMVEEIAADVDELVLGIGSAGDSHTTRNPFTAGERVMMVTKAVEDLDVTTYVVPIEDLDRNSVWVSHVRSMTPRFDVAYSNNPLVVRLFEEAGVEVRQSPMFRRDVLEGTELRERMIRGREWEGLVPDAVVDVIREVDGVDRIRRIAETDTLGKEPSDA